MSTRAAPSELLADRGVERWLRRAATLPGYALLALVTWLGLPLWLALAALADVLLLRGPWVATRAVAFFALYLGCELAGLLGAAVLWLGDRLIPGRSPERFARWNFALQQRWAAALFWGARRLFGLHIETRGLTDALARSGKHPVLVFIRHASTADVILPAAYLSRPGGVRLRYVMKRELLWDPCLDVVGQRLPNVFIRRASDDPEREIALVRALASGLGPGDGVLIYPEGTRFTPAKQQRILERLAEARSPRLDAAKALRHVLPPKLGGPLALLDACPDGDVVFLAHTGFEGIRSFHEFARGALVGRRVTLETWRIPAEDIPADAQGRADWLDAQWRRLDDWIDEHQA